MIHNIETLKVPCNRCLRDTIWTSVLFERKRKWTIWTYVHFKKDWKVL